MFGLQGQWGAPVPPSTFSQPPPWSGMSSPPPAPAVHVIPSSLPPPPPPPTPAPIMPPVKPTQQCSDFLQHALDTVTQAQGHAARHHQDVAQTVLPQTNPQGGLRGVKRKGLAVDLLSAKAGSHHLDWVSKWDTSMPPELLAKCKPLHCELCNCQATSPMQSKMHYEGKTHDKHVRMYFTSLNAANPMNSSMPLPQKMTNMDSKSKADYDPRPSGLHCSVCNLTFTSFPQVEQHLAGKNHQRLSNGLSGVKPGYFNKDIGKWQKQPFGEDTLHSPFSSTTPTPEPPAGSNHKLYCQLCKVGAPSQSQMDMHLNGKSHKAKMKKSMGEVENGDLETIKTRVQMKDKILAICNKSSFTSSHVVQRRRHDFSQYRTPSGQYYCAPCNISLNSDNQFEQHQISKKHKQNEAKFRTKK